MLDTSTNRAVWAQIDTALERSLDWLDARALPAAKGRPAGVMALSAAHDIARWPGLCLPATYNGLMCLDLLGALQDRGPEERQALSGWLGSFQGDDGAFRIPGMNPADTYKKPDAEETRRYVEFHVTNYALGAQEALGSEIRAPGFVRDWLDPVALRAWLADRDLRDPWLEGNNIVNLASFLLVLKRHGDAADCAAADAALAILFDWHDRMQEPATGFWGVGQAHDPRALLHAMAGSMHNYHLYYACGRSLPYQTRAAAYVLSRDPVWHSACIDVDEVDLLVHAAESHPELRADVAAWLTRKLTALLSMQNADGGFADTLTDGWRQDGWVRGPVEAPGMSTTFATWFRWIAIAMIDDYLWPGRRDWRFRRMIGIGYRRREAPNG